MRAGGQSTSREAPSLTEIDLEELRSRLRKMTDDDLLRFGKAARFMCRDKVPRQVFLIQLDEARAKWRRRHPKEPSSTASTRITIAPRVTKAHVHASLCRSGM
jgi:hypothetical protein